MSKDVLIIGGGVIGLSAAYYAIQKGHRVTLVERGGPDHDCCSLGNAGMIVPSHSVPLTAPGMVARGLRMMWNPESPFYIKPRFDWDLVKWSWRFIRAANRAHVERGTPLLLELTLASRQCFEELAALPETDFGLEAKGLVVVYRTDHALAVEAKTALEAQRHGLVCEVLQPDEVAARNPNIRLDIAGGIHFPDDCYLSPQRLIAALTRLVEGAGVSIVWSTEVTDWRVEAGRIKAAKTIQGDMAADEIVVAAGAWSQQAVRSLGLELPLQAAKGYSLTLSEPPQRPTTGLILGESWVAVTPMDDSLRFAGTLELAGLDETLNPARVRGIVKAVPAYLPDFGPEDFAAVTPWCGLRPCSPDGLPYIGRTRHISNLTVTTGHGMLGVSLGPITGKLVADILSDQGPPFDLALLDPDRYA